MLPILELGPLSIPVPALLILFGFWSGSVLLEKFAPRFNVDPKLIERLLWTGFAVGLFGARISFLVRFPAAFQGDWLSIFSLNLAFLDPGGGILLGLFAIILIIFREGHDIKRLFDLLLLFTLCVLFFYFLARFAAGSGPGTPTTLPWGIAISGAVRHPVQIYLAVMWLAGLVISFSRILQNNLAPGALGALVLIYISGTMLFFSRFQEISGTLISGFRSDQILFYLLMLASMFLYHRLQRPD